MENLIDYIYDYSFIILSSSFCLLASVVLIYYVRRKYLLHFEIKSISQDELMLQSFQNHRKNLRIKALISNFIIIIVVVEIVFIFANLLLIIQILIPFGFLERFEFLSNYSLIISFNCHLPTLCMFLKVLWLIYLHSPYKYTIIRWTWYIVVRCVVSCISYYLADLNLLHIHWLIPPSIIFSAIIPFSFISDIIFYLVYARRLYIQLQSREKEARWFKGRAEYRTARSLRLHYKIATILVALGIGGLIILPLSVFLDFLSNLNSLELFDRFDENYHFHVYRKIITYCDNHYIYALGSILYLSLYNLNYLYIVSMMVFNYCKQKRQQTNVNNKIKPIVKRYHDTLYYRRC